MRKLPTGNRLVCRYLKCSGRRNGNEYMLSSITWKDQEIMDSNEMIFM